MAALKVLFFSEEEKNGDDSSDLCDDNSNGNGYIDKLSKESEVDNWIIGETGGYTHGLANLIIVGLLRTTNVVEISDGQSMGSEFSVGERMDVSIHQVWSLKEEPCRANNWKPDEVFALLKTIKTNNLMKGYPSSTQLGQLVEPLLGYRRTAFQITGKLKNLRKSYLTCEKRGCTAAARRECPYYDALAEVYGIETNDDSDPNNVDSAEDIKVTSERGIEKMLNVIKDFNLSPDSTTRNFAPSAIRLISKMLIARGVCATAEQVKSTLADLRKNYLEFRKTENTSHDSCKNVHFESLRELWGCVSVSDPPNARDAPLVRPKSELHSTKEKTDFWSDEETCVLLTSIKALNLTDEAATNTEAAATRLRDVLKNRGYVRSRFQIRKKLDALRNDYNNVRCDNSLDNAVEKFPFYSLYDSVFNTNDLRIPDFRGSEAIDELNRRRRSDDYDDDDSIVRSERTKHSRSHSWSDDETVLMLTLLEDLNLASSIAHRLSFEIACKLVGPMRDNGYDRSAMQIQIKLRNLRKSYYRCARAAFSMRAIAECPFYDRLNEMFKQPRDGKSGTVKKLERADGNFGDGTESFVDHSYSNSANRIDGSCESGNIEGDNSDKDCGEHWLPVETICDESIGDEISVNNEEVSGLEGSNEPETLTINDNDETPIDNDTGQTNRLQNPKNLKLPKKMNKITNENDQSPGSSKKLSEKSNFSSPPRGWKRNSTRFASFKTNKHSTTLKSIRTVMAEVLRQEKLLQRQHHSWMERQFEIQRKHDREQRELLIDELRQFRKAVTSRKNHLPDDCT